MAVYTTGGGVAPKRVQFVEYIQSSGTQYIDTGFKPNQNTKVEVVWQSDSDKGGIVAADATWLDRGFGVFVNIAEFGSYSHDWGIVKQKRTTAIDRGRIYSEGNLLNTFTGTFQTPCSLVLFANNRNGAMSEFTTTKIYSCKIYDNGILIRDYLPVLDGDGVACLYDAVSEAYAYNAGTGTFVTGGVV